MLDQDQAGIQNSQLKVVIMKIKHEFLVDGSDHIAVNGPTQRFLPPLLGRHVEQGYCVGLEFREIAVDVEPTQQEVGNSTDNHPLPGLRRDENRRAWPCPPRSHADAIIAEECHDITCLLEVDGGLIPIARGVRVNAEHLVLFGGGNIPKYTSPPSKTTCATGQQGCDFITCNWVQYGTLFLTRKWREAEQIELRGEIEAPVVEGYSFDDDVGGQVDEANL